MGFAEIRNLVLAKAVFGSFRQLKKNNDYDMRKFWEHSFLCGLAATIIAADQKQDACDFFIAGLIHDIGKLVFFMELPEQFLKTVTATSHPPFMTFYKEKEILGISHDEAGRMLLNKWLFPENLISAVGFHHRPLDAKKAPVFPAVVNAADMLVHTMETAAGKNMDPSVLKLVFHPEIVTLLNLHKITWNTDTYEKHKEALNIQKQEKADMLSLLLS